MGKNAAGREAVTHVLLRPAIAFGGARRPTDDEIRALHHDAHEQCYIANSVTTEVEVGPPTVDA
jgi:organic hydroperoxide reductase OsmC/OhrA